MHRYNADEAPAAKWWLSLDERRRIQLAEEFHSRARIKERNAKLHAVFHASVENQIAEGLPSVVRAMARLEAQGLSRHDCVHAVASVLALQFHELMDADEAASPATVRSRYDAAIDRLDADTWRGQASS